MIRLKIKTEEPKKYISVKEIIEKDELFLSTKLKLKQLDPVDTNSRSWIGKIFCRLKGSVGFMPVGRRGLSYIYFIRSDKTIFEIVNK